MTVPSPPQAPARDSLARATGGRDILADTVAEMTWYEVEQAARAGAVALWAFGVIEQHGPHLPTGTDVYLPSAHLRHLRAELAGRGIRALIIPPYYWGVNGVSASFPASYRVRPELMRELMADVFASLETDGFSHVFCFSGHGEALHNQTIHAGIALGAQRTALDISFVLDALLATRLGLSLTDPHLSIASSGRPGLLSAAIARERQAPAPQAPRYMDVHAGREETSMMMCACPELVRESLRVGLAPTNLGLEDLQGWRKGHLHSRRKTPQGYFGDPAAASGQEGVEVFLAAVRRSADAIEDRLKGRAAGA